MPSNTIQAGDNVTLTITGVTNPTTSGTLDFSTSSDTNQVPLSVNVTPANAASSVTFVSSTTAAGATGVTYTVNFIASDTGALAGGSGGIALTAPTGTVFPTYFFDFDSEYSIVDNTNSSGSGLAQATTSNGGATANIVPSNTIQAGDNVTLTITGVTNPTTSGTLDFSTSSDTNQVPLSVNVTPANAASSVTFVSSTTAADYGSHLHGQFHCLRHWCSRRR